MTRMRHGTLALLLLVSALLGGCSPDGSATVHLTAVVKGWSDDEAQTYEADLAVDGSMRVPFENDDLTITVVAIGDRIDIKTSQGLSPVNPNGGIDLTTSLTSFTLTPGDELELSTTSMDGGTFLTLTVE